MHPVGVHMGTPTGYPLMGALKGTHMCTLWVHIYVTIMGHPMGAPYVHPYGVHIIFLLLVARPLAFGSLPAPVMHPYGVHMGTPTGYPL